MRRGRTGAAAIALIAASALLMGGAGASSAHDADSVRRAEALARALDPTLRDNCGCTAAVRARDRARVRAEAAAATP